jgi:gliding motility-associated lipoprotein GldH
MNNKLFAFLFSIIIFLCSCSKNEYYDLKAFKDEKWDYNDWVEFNIPITDTTNLYNLHLILRTTQQYPYTNIYLFVQNIPFTGNIIQDTLLLILYDENGKSLGKKSNKNYIYDFLIKKNYTPPQNGNYTLLVTHGMRDSILPGIVELGFKFEKIKNNER